MDGPVRGVRLALLAFAATALIACGGSLVVVNTGSSYDSFGVTVDFVVRELIPAVSR
jgi:hypothetical protein